MLIPSFISSRRETPIRSTESFARSTARLAAVRAVSAETAANRSRVRARRKQVLVFLGGAAVATLAAAILSGSWAVLSLNLVVDALLAAYVAMLLQVKEYSLANQMQRAGSPLQTATQAEVKVVVG